MKLQLLALVVCGLVLNCGSANFALAEEQITPGANPTKIPQTSKMGQSQAEKHVNNKNAQWDPPTIDEMHHPRSVVVPPTPPPTTVSTIYIDGPPEEDEEYPVLPTIYHDGPPEEDEDYPVSTTYYDDPPWDPPTIDEILHPRSKVMPKPVSE